MGGRWSSGALCVTWSGCVALPALRRAAATAWARLFVAVSACDGAVGGWAGLAGSLSRSSGRSAFGVYAGPRRWSGAQLPAFPRLSARDWRSPATWTFVGGRKKISGRDCPRTHPLQSWNLCILAKYGQLTCISGQIGPHLHSREITGDRSAESVIPRLKRAARPGQLKFVCQLFSGNHSTAAAAHFGNSRICCANRC